MGSVLRSVGASQGNIWTVAPFIPVKMGSKNTKSAKNQKAPNRCCWNFQDFLDRVPGAQISWSGKRRIFWPIPSLRHGVTVHKFRTWTEKSEVKQNSFATFCCCQKSKVEILCNLDLMLLDSQPRSLKSATTATMVGGPKEFAVVAKRSPIEDLVLMRTKLLKWSSFGCWV